MSFSRLERLGLEVCAYTLLGSRGRGALLMALIDANGRTVTYDRLTDARAWRMPHYEDAAGKNGLKTRMCRLREAMEDIGLGGLIVTQDGGYALPQPARDVVVDRLMAEAA